MKLKLQYLGHLMWRADSLEKTLMLGKIEGRRGRGDRGQDGWMASLTQWTWVWASLDDGEVHLLWYYPWGCKESDMTEKLKNNNYVLLLLYSDITNEKKIKLFSITHLISFQIHILKLSPTVFGILFVVVYSLSRVWLFCKSVDYSLPCSSVHRIFQQEYWSELPFLIPGDLPNPGMESGSPALAGRFLTTKPPEKPVF